MSHLKSFLLTSALFQSPLLPKLLLSLVKQVICFYGDIILTENKKSKNRNYTPYHPRYFVTPAQKKNYLILAYLDREIIGGGKINIWLLGTVTGV